MSDRGKRRFLFTPTHKTLQNVLADNNLAALGDAYTNLVFSLYLSLKTGIPTGSKTNNRILSDALRQAELREHMTTRIDRHKQADAAEALLVYTWLQGSTTISQDVDTLSKCKDVVEGFKTLLFDAKRKFGA